MSSKIDFETDLLSYTRHQGFAVVRLRKRTMSVFRDLEYWESYMDALSAAQESKDIRGFAQISSSGFTGVEEVESFLTSLVESVPEEYDAAQIIVSRLKNLELRFALEVAKFQKPLVAGIEGPVPLEYLGFMLPCDFRIAASDAWFIPHISLGFPAIGLLSFCLPRCVGLLEANRILLSDRAMSAEEAMSMGLVDRIVPAGEVEKSCLSKLSELSQLPRACIAGVRKALTPASQDLERHLESSIECIWRSVVEEAGMSANTQDCANHPRSPRLQC